MADNGPHDRAAAAVEPPGGGRQDHDVMRAASMRPVSGPASTDTLAAGGGTDVPGREPHPELAAAALAGGQAPGVTRVPEPIPGEREPGNLTHRELGSMGGQFAGADIPRTGGGTMDARTALERAREGGGHDAARGTRRTHDK